MKYLKKFKFPIVHSSLSIILILTAGAFLRFWGLNWGLPYPFHPDERNMAEAITRFSPTNLDPHFYAYGQFPLYLAYFTETIFLSLIKRKAIDALSFTQAIFALRFWSAIFSTTTIYIAYLIAKRLFPKNLFTIYYLLFTISFTPGLIQSAHFGTTESILAFCFMAIVYFSLRILENPVFPNFFWVAFFLGIALGSKISATVFIFPLFLSSLILLKNTQNLKERLKIFLFFLFTFILSLTFIFFTSPYLLLKFQESRGTLLYEISVAQGKPVLFYTRQFINTTPVLFQFEKIFPYALGWPTFLFGLLGTVFCCFTILKSLFEKKPHYSWFVIYSSFLIYFFSQAFLFTKWTRFMAPLFPFFPIFASYSFSKISPFLKSKRLFVIYYLLFAISIVPGLLFSNIYFRPDVRFVASKWIYQNIPSGSYVLSETANVVDIPIYHPNYQSLITNYSLNPVSFNFYDLDENPKVFQKLLDELVKSDYIFIPSRRIFANHLRIPEKYPLIAKYYQLLFSEKLGFKEIKTINPSPKFSIFNFQFSINDEVAEETFTVFDHPVIRIYKKITPFSKQEYEKLFEEN